jgi:single-strand selective monofunctional uracil DNA glycosylase
MEASGKNLTPDKLRASEAGPLAEACDAHLADVIRAVGAEWVIGVGAFAEGRATAVRDSRGLDIRVGRIPHPSPANPAANRGWAKMAEGAMIQMGPWKELAKDSRANLGAP